MNYLVKFFFHKGILSIKYKIFSIFLIFSLILTSILEMISIGLIIPVLDTLLDKNSEPKFNFFIDKLTDTDNFTNQDYLRYFIILLIIVFALKNTYIFLQNFIQITFIKKVTLLAQYKMIINYSKKNIGYFKNINSSEILRNFQSELIIFTNIVLNRTFTIISEILVVLAIVSLIFYVEPKISFAILSFFILISSIYYLFISKKLSKYGFDRHHYTKETLRVLSELIHMFPQVKLLNKKKFFFQRVNISFSKVIVSLTKKQFYSPILRLIVEFAMVFSIGVLIIFSIMEEKQTHEIITFIGVLAAAAFRLLPSILRINTSLHELKYNLPTAKTITELISSSKLSNEIKSNYPKKIITRFSKLEFKNLNFSFKDKEIFNNLNFKIEKNKIYGIKGESGSGKTTLLNILIGLYDATAEILYNDEKISHTKQIQNHMCYVPQDVYLYDDSILNNIILGDDVDEDIIKRVEVILKKLKLDDTINLLPKGINTPVGENGAKLSGGQIQRIGLARAMYHKKEIIFLDEFTSSLDDYTESKILSFLKDLNNDLTIVIVSHRQEPLKICDEIFEITNKRIKKVILES